MKEAIWLLLPLFILLCGPASADFYKYTDQNGNIRFTDDMSKVPEDQRSNFKRYEESKVTPQTSTPANKTDATQRAPEIAPTPNIGDDMQEKQIKEKKAALEREHKALMEEKATLEAGAKKAKTIEASEHFNREISKLNKKISQYDQKRKAYNAEAKAYNERMTQHNKNKK